MPPPQGSVIMTTQSIFIYLLIDPLKDYWIISPNLVSGY